LNLAYLICLLVSIAGLAAIDWRFKLCFFANEKRWAIALGASIALFVVVDLIAVTSGMFLDGNSPYATGLFLPGSMPIEEPFFLALMCYSAAIFVVAFARFGAGSRSGRK
jgi:lycopene cyclase domain-containing protein